MPWSDLADLMGASALVMAILLVFWKGDDCISKEFRDDIAAWLILLKPPSAQSPVAKSVLAIFENTFGRSHLSLRCIATSVAFSSVFLFAFLYFFTAGYSSTNPMGDAVNPEPEPSLSRVEILRSYFWAPVWYLLLLSAIINFLVDFFSLMITRMMLHRASLGDMKLSVCIFLDATLSAALFALVFYVTSAYSSSLVYLSSGAFEQVLVWATVMWVNVQQFGFFWFLVNNNDVTGIILRATVLTTFITSIWIWAAALGSLVLRLLARSGPLLRALQYGLPIEERPVRSIGIVSFLFVFVFLLISTLANVGMT